MVKCCCVACKADEGDQAAYDRCEDIQEWTRRDMYVDDLMTFLRLKVQMGELASEDYNSTMELALKWRDEVFKKDKESYE